VNDVLCTIYVHTFEKKYLFVCPKLEIHGVEAQVKRCNDMCALE